MGVFVVIDDRVANDCDERLRTFLFCRNMMMTVTTMMMTMMMMMMMMMMMTTVVVTVMVMATTLVKYIQIAMLTTATRFSLVFHEKKLFFLHFGRISCNFP